MSKVVKIGGACGFYGDSSVAPTQLMKAGVDYLILDYLAEATMSVLGSMRQHRANLGYAFDFTEWVWKDNLALIKQTGTKIVTNAGGVNPHACAERMRKIAADAGMEFRIAVITGDEMLNRMDDYAKAGTKELFTGQAFPPVDKINTANAYLGGTPIARALAMGADMVITGRVVDSALTLGILMHEHGWTAQQYDQLCAGSLAGHVIECGAQATGGLFTDWQDVPDWAHIGYPIIECHKDGSFVVTKPEGTGGLVTTAVVAEQILYEVGDPQAYMLPDVVCDFTRLQLSQIGENRVKVDGAVGYPPTGSYKLSITWKDGDRIQAFMPIVGRDAAGKAQKQCEAIVTRLEDMLREKNIGPFRAKRIEIIGAESSYGAQARAHDTREVVAKLAVEHDDPTAFKFFLREFDSPTTSMAVGTTGWFGSRAEVKPVMRVYSTLIARGDVPITIDLDGKTETMTVTNGVTYDPAKRLPVDPVPAVQAEGETRSVPLIDIAWARSGDKGDAFNIGVIARRPEYLPYIRAALTPERMMQWFAHEFEDATDPAVLRYDVPGLNAINLHFLNSLGGGQFASLRLDPLAKAKAQQLLDIEISIPADLAA